MKYHVDQKTNTAAYLQLYIALREDIVSGVYQYGTKLPSKRLLSEETGVSVITVEHAYSILCDEGYAESRERSGYYVIYREKDFISVGEVSTVRKISEKNTDHLASAFPFSVLSKTMRRVISEYGDRILIKSPSRGCDELIEAIRAYLARSTGISVRAEQIIIGAGAEYLYGLIVQLIGHDRVFAIEDPSYEKIEKVYRAHGVRYDKLKLSHDGIKTSELERTEATVLHITPFNSFPSNITADASKRNEYIRFAKERNGYIVEDNFDSELTVSTKSEDTVFSLDPDGAVIYVNTFSHTIAPSMRVGYMLLPSGLLDVFDKNFGFYSCTVPVFEQYTIAELINSGDFERHINRVRRMRRKNR